MYFHLSNFTTGAFSPNGNLLRTEGNSTFINQWAFFTGVNTVSATRKFRVFNTLGNLLVANGTTDNADNITLEASQHNIIFNAGGDEVIGV